MYLGPFQNKILFQNKFLFLFCRPLKYFSLPILLSEQIVIKWHFIFIFFPPSSEDLSKFKCAKHFAKQGIKKSRPERTFLWINECPANYICSTLCYSGCRIWTTQDFIMYTAFLVHVWSTVWFLFSVPSRSHKFDNTYFLRPQVCLHCKYHIMSESWFQSYMSYYLLNHVKNDFKIKFQWILILLRSDLM
jgi:hypothetical protein